MIDAEARDVEVQHDENVCATPQSVCDTDTDDTAGTGLDDSGHASPPDSGGAPTDERDQIPPSAADLEPAARKALRRRLRDRQWARIIAFRALPVLVMLSALPAGWLKYHAAWLRDSDIARIESVHAAADAATKMLSYRPDTVESDLTSARQLLTGSFKDSYTSLTHDVVIPGAKQKQISAVATIPAAASVSATPTRAVVLVFVDQTIVIGNDAPSATASSVRVTMDKLGGRWLITDFTPV